MLTGGALGRTDNIKRMKRQALRPTAQLPEETARRIFTGRIVADLLVGTPSKDPIVVFVAGQPGAGKSRVQAAMRKRLRPVTVVEIDADDMRSYHPAYERLALADDRTAAALTHPTAQLWVHMAVDHVITQRLNAVVAATFSSSQRVAEKITRFREAGYRVEVAYLAVDDCRSRLSVLARYQQQRATYGYGRYVPPEVQAEAYTSLLSTAELIERDSLADTVYVFSRDGELAGNRAHSTGASQMIGAVRSRPWTAEQTMHFSDTALELRKVLAEDLQSVLDTIVDDAWAAKREVYS